MMTDTERNELAEKIADELTDWAVLHGYDVNDEPFIGTAFDYAYADAMDNVDDYDFLDALDLAQDNGVFDRLNVREFDNEFPNPNEYVLAMNDNDGKLGIFYDDSFGWCGASYRKINRNEVPLNWFDNYRIFNEWDI